MAFKDVVLECFCILFGDDGGAEGAKTRVDPVYILVIGNNLLHLPSTLFNNCSNGRSYPTLHLSGSYLQGDPGSQVIFPVIKIFFTGHIPYLSMQNENRKLPINFQSIPNNRHTTT